MSEQTTASDVEIVRRRAGPAVRAVLLDFDGTLSLIRTGWQEVMIPLMVEALAAAAPNRPAEELRAVAAADVERTSGRATIHQMRQLAERVRELGARAGDPWAYKAAYDRRLMAHIAERRARLAGGRTQPDTLLLAGARAFLEALSDAGVRLALASGTDQERVREEAELLRIARYFGQRIYGATRDERASSKRTVVERLLADEAADGAALAVFGDGFVEIEEAKRVGGYAVGVASDERAGGGRVNARKRRRLLAAGADAIVADFRPREALLRLLGVSP